MCRLASFLFVPFCLLAIFCSHSEAEVQIRPQPTPWQVKASDYEARVDWDGCLTSLRVFGQEFLASNVSISRGSYFFHNGALQLQDIEQSEVGKITAKGDLTSIEYSFADDGMVWKLANHSDVDLVFFTVFAGSMNGLREGKGEIQTAAINSGESRLTCYQGDARLDVIGLEKLWGPWQGPHQVGQVNLKPGEQKEIRITIGKATSQEHQQIVKLHTMPLEPELVLLSPRSYQVFQRHTVGEGEVLVSGRCSVEANEVEMRLHGESSYGVISDEWTSIPLVSAVQEFNARLKMPAGGWYSVDIRAKHEGKVVAEGHVEQFGVGEVFVGAGQSNSTNCGEFKTKQTTGMVSSFGGEKWKIADDPQLGVADRTQGGSFWPAFGDAMYEKYKVPIGVATTGYGGTSINQWQPDGDLFKWMITRVHQLGPGGFRALLWHQGESDIAMAEDEYYEKLRKTITGSRTQAGWEFPWFVAKASYHNPDKPNFDNIRNAQQRLWDDGIALTGPDTDTLTGDHRDMGGKGIHLSPKGLKVHGQMWARLVGEHLDEVLSSE